MARVRQKELSWPAVAGADVYDVYGEIGEAADFESRADAGTAPKLGETVSLTYSLAGLADGTWQFAVVGRDSAGNTGDPGVVRATPLDQTAPAAVVGLVVRFTS